MSRSKPLEETRQYTESTLLDQYRATQQQLQALIDFNVKGASQASHTADEVYHSAFAAVIGVLLVAGLATVVLAWLFTRSITQPIGEALRVAEVIASGDLTSRIDTSGRDEPAKLLVALQGMQAQLRQTIQQIGSSATQLASAAEELSAVTEQGNRSLTQQNDEIQMAATAVNEMTAAVEEVARNASSTSDASSASEQSAQNGRQRVLETVQAIRLMSEEVDNTSALVGGLAEKAQDISKVLDVIRGIAEQTNLLALNAAIEAARAGEQGRGFAVVADEVRALAHRTQESTREIEQMIANIQEGTGAAVGAMDSSSVRARNMLEIAEAAGLALNEIAERVGQINERTLVIASASEQQAQVAREVDRNLVNIRDISLQTSAGSNQTAAASQELSQLAIDLNNMVTRFVVDHAVRRLTAAHCCGCPAWSPGFTMKPDPLLRSRPDGQAHQPQASQLSSRPPAGRDRRRLVDAHRARCLRRTDALRRIPEEPRPGQEHPGGAPAQPGGARRDGGGPGRKRQSPGIPPD